MEFAFSVEIAFSMEFAFRAIGKLGLRGGTARPVSLRGTARTDIANPP
jgi:hypothetical protein